MPAVRPKVLLLTAYAALLVYLGGIYFGHYPVPGFFLRLREILTVLGFLWAAAGVGKKLLSRLLPGEEEAEGFLWSAALGAAVFSLALLGLGLAGLFKPAWMAGLTLALAAVSWKDILAWFKKARRVLETLSRRAFQPADVFLIVLGAAVFGATLLCALAPPTYYDSLVYHLALPAKYLQEGRVGFVPYNHYSHFPQNMEMVFAWFLALGDDVSAQIFQVVLAGLTLAALYGLGRKVLRASGFRWDLWLFLSAPCLAFLSSETYVEVPMAFWTTLALWAGVEGLFKSNRRWLVLSGILGGFAAGIKYTGVLTPALLGLGVLLWPRPRPLRERGGDVAALALPAFLVFLPWLAKNYFFTGGNPVFPFLSQWLPAKNVYLYQEAAQAYFQVLNEYKGSSSLLAELFGLPLRLVSNTLSFGGGYDVTGDLGWALPLLLLPLAFFALERDRARRFLLAYLGLHVLLWVSLRPVLRFLFPVFPLTCLFAGLGLAKVLENRKTWLKGLAAGVLALFTLSNGVLFALVEGVRDPFAAAWGLESRDEYLRRKLDAYPLWEFMNQNLPPDSRVLFVGDQRGYYCERPYLAPMAHLPQPLRQWADEAGAGRRLREKLLEWGFTHVFFHRREAERLKSYGVLDLTERGQKAWAEMIETLPRVREGNGMTLYSLQEPLHG